MRCARPIGGHSVDAFTDANGGDVFIGSSVAHDTHARYGEENGEVLPHFFMKSRFFDLFSDDLIRVSKDVEFGSVDRAEVSNRKAGTAGIRQPPGPGCTAEGSAEFPCSNAQVRSAEECVKNNSVFSRDLASLFLPVSFTGA